MPTINQLVRKGRQAKPTRNKVPALEACPQKRGVCACLYNNAEEAEFGASEELRVCA